jgi:hypothetical protein
MVKEALTAKVSPKTIDRLEDYVEREQISKSEGTARLLKQGLDVEESDMRLVPVKSDGGTVIENELEYTQNQIQSTQNQVNEISNDLDEMIAVYRKVGPTMLAGVIWIGIESTVGIPGGTVWTLTTGFFLMVLLLVQYLRAIVNKGDYE